mmetsp:Transcript_3312/g.6334  ORF Transcript_3312/g.6334 Transcript_3312/m.6334 type:complete len:206 (-) Transcript_3312:750-1367(-)
MMNKLTPPQNHIPAKLSAIQTNILIFPRISPPPLYRPIINSLPPRNLDAMRKLLHIGITRPKRHALLFIRIRLPVRPHLLRPKRFRLPPKLGNHPRPLIPRTRLVHILRMTRQKRRKESFERISCHRHDGSHAGVIVGQFALLCVRSVEVERNAARGGGFGSAGGSGEFFPAVRFAGFSLDGFHAAVAEEGGDGASPGFADVDEG